MIMFGRFLNTAASANHHLVWLQKGPPRFSEESILQLERELVQARLKEAESQCALKEMQDKILDMEKVRCTGAALLNSYPVQTCDVTYYPIFVLNTSI